MLTLICQQIAATARRPWRLLRLWRLPAFLECVAMETLAWDAHWERMPNGLFRRTDCQRFYRWVQRAKCAHVPREPHFSTYRRIIAERYVDADLSGPVLCLASRYGGEVAGFRDLGLFAVGVDLRPPRESTYTLADDFHGTAFPDGSVGTLFSNSLDHIMDWDRFVAECRRLLRPGGQLVIEIPNGHWDEPQKHPRACEWLWWDYARDVQRAIGDAGYAMVESQRIDYPFVGLGSRWIAK